MAGANACWGIEIGAYALKALKLERDGDTLRIADFAYIPHKKVLSTPDVDADDVTRLTIGAFVSQYDLSRAAIAVSVPGHMAFARFAKLPPVEPKKIPDIVRFEAVQQIPFPIEEVVWDFQTFVSEHSPDVEVGIFAITNERVEDRLHMWSEMGLDPNVVTLSPVAAYNAIAYDEIFSETTPGTILLDIGTTSTDLIIAEEGRTWIRTFPLGGHQFTEELAETFKLNYAKAEKLKRETATSQYKRQILQAMRPIFGDVVSDVQQSIGYYQSLHPDARLTRIIGLGSTFQLPGMRKYLSQQLNMEVVRLDDFKRARLADTGDAARFAEHVPNFATAYGLALQGLGDETIRANLMPRQVLRKQMWASKTKWFATAAAVAVVASGMMFVRPVLDAQAAGGSVAGVIDRAVNYAKRLDNEKRDIAEANQIGAKGANTLGLVNGVTVWPHIVSDLNAALASANPQPELVAGTPDGFESVPVGQRRLLWFKSLETEYIRPATGGDTGFSGRGVPDEPDPDALNNQEPLIQCRMVVRTTHDDRQAFVNDTVVAWLRANAIRADVPYIIDIDRQPPNISIAVIPPSEAGESSATRPSTGRQPRTTRPGGRNPYGTEPSRPGTTSRGTSNRDLAAMSDFPDPPPIAPPDREIYEVTVTWVVKLLKPGVNAADLLKEGGDA
jgi:type IV pilus assembly protein PilM